MYCLVSCTCLICDGTLLLCLYTTSLEEILAAEIGDPDGFKSLRYKIQRAAVIEALGTATDKVLITAIVDSVQEVRTVLSLTVHIL